MPLGLLGGGTKYFLLSKQDISVLMKEMMLHLIINNPFLIRLRMMCPTLLYILKLKYLVQLLESCLALHTCTIHPVRPSTQEWRWEGTVEAP